MNKKEIIEDMAWTYVNASNGAENKDDNIDTLFNFGSFGLRTPREICEMFYDEVVTRLPNFVDEDYKRVSQFKYKPTGQYIIEDLGHWKLSNEPATDKEYIDEVYINEIMVDLKCLCDDIEIIYDDDNIKA